jgi:hypothetical protein
MIKGEKGREELEDLLLSYFQDITHNRNMVLEFQEYLSKEHFIPRVKTTGILNGNIPIQGISAEELYLVNKLVYENCLTETGNKRTELDPKEHFNVKEIQDGENYKEVKIEDESNDLILKNVIVQDYETYKVYKCFVNNYFIGDMNNRGLYNYDPKTQRQLTKRVIRGRVVEKPTIIQSKVKQIMKSLEAKKPNQNWITINVPHTGSEQFEYDEKSGVLTIRVDGINTRACIIDSFHRFRAVNELLKVKPDFEYPYELIIYNMSEDLAGLMVSSINLQTPIETLHVETMKDDKPYLNMAKEINTARNEKENELYMRFGEDHFDVENNPKIYTTFNLFSQAVKFNFDPKEQKSVIERRLLQKYLLEAFIYVIGTFKSDFQNKNVSRETSIITEANTIIGIIALLAEIQEKYGSDWEEKILDILASIDFSNKKDADWKEIGIYVKNINSTHLKKISNYFRQFVK